MWLDFHMFYGIKIGGTLGSKKLVEIVNMHFTTYYGHAGTFGACIIEVEFKQESKPA
ncbi:hypothetical protein B2J93_2265 [Marssonina coronariae]|uniref:Uncharacterized protein n=1 Tax=Diplocarpon coronariae TaxID=2795749 RepID=A0A218YVQ4_9HELO|nr:hypothetical protein B2J93_2265 [Marssonina coronariae]